MAVIDFFDKGWASAPTAVAYRTVDEAWTYDDAGRMSCRIAHALLREGITKETPVAVLSPNAPLAWICVLGIWRSGAAWVPLNPGSPAADNAALIERFDVELILYDTSLADDVAAIEAAYPRVRAFALDTSTDTAVSNSWIGDAPDTPVDVVYNLNDVVALMPTGGTTGFPKGVMNTHRSLSVMVVHQMLALSYDDGEPIVNLVAAPMTHTAGLLTLQTTARGGTVAIIERAAPDLILDAISEFGVTDLFLPPTVVYRLLDVLEHRDADTSSLRYLLYGAAPMSVDKLRAGVNRLGSVFLQLYGQVEAPAGIAFLRPSEHLVGGELAPDDRLSSCGRPYPLVSLRVVDPITDLPVAPGTTGEICVRGDLVMKGYYKDPEKTAEAIVDGWLHTGDLGHLDETGYLHLTDRRKDLIITGGFNVYPNEVEQVIWTHPSVEDCAVVGAPDDDWGERVTAVVELKPNHTVDAEELIALCRQKLGGVRTPKRVFFVDSLPRSVNGKVLKKDVRAQFWADSGRAI
ncbi:long-chain fatty acid--CoA ligase [Rhodococcus sp. Leaf278]|uniref:class I adenylate-forming enzyme family protein n=1 Tax=Rhodococcus sp. Leaf278 TaxID=1736319 RepID=UPI00070CB5F5|nr:AMP-binding protein [Rhodococcus sp. Leaf278]KQU47215.1 long-chain fatty acid--CoA ligase [Rhodococcus sp. Leaf278]